MSFKAIERCRFDKSPVVPILSLGEQYLTGIFPSSKDEEIEQGPLELVLGTSSGLLQLRHTFSLEKMYGMNYGYRSSLNGSMLTHLKNKAKFLEKTANLKETDVVLDIGSNDGSLLSMGYTVNAKKIGIDPTGIKFAKYYPNDIVLVSDFFTKENFINVSNKKAKIITSIAMFYDLEDIDSFVSDIEQCLDDNGIWHLEQSYMPAMIRANAYDTICHEHIEYYSLMVIKKIVEKHGMKIADVSVNNINGGSFAVTVVKNSNNEIFINNAVIEWMLEKEYIEGYQGLEPFYKFKNNVVQHKRDFVDLIHKLKNNGKTIYGYGASTKGNVLLQYCGLTSNEITSIAEVNEDKFGCYTPGTKIPITSEKEVMAKKPDYLLVLPWHFRESIVARESEFLARGGKFIFPCPTIEIV